MNTLSSLLEEEYQSAEAVVDWDQESGNRSVTKFIMTTFAFLKESKYSEIVAWSKDGNEFVIKQTKRFADEVLWEFFGHRNVSTFTRQMNLYGFKRCASEIKQIGFMHPLFRQSSRELAMIKRKKRVGDTRYVGAAKEREEVSMPNQQNSLSKSPSLSVTRNGSLNYSPRISGDILSPKNTTSDRKYSFRLVDESSENQSMEPQLHNASSPLLSSEQNVQDDLVDSCYQLAEEFIPISNQAESNFTIASQLIEELRLIRLQLQRQNQEMESLASDTFIRRLLSSGWLE